MGVRSKRYCSEENGACIEYISRRRKTLEGILCKCDIESLLYSHWMVSLDRNVIDKSGGLLGFLEKQN